jgi:hypothetical protein
MTKADTIIAELVDALDLAYREADKENCSRHYIVGVCEFAIRRANAQRVRNEDGYLVVKSC